MNKRSLWKPRKMVGGLLGPLVLLALFPAPANAYPRPGITERVSVASDGAQANSASAIPTISGDGRYVAFSSDASNLVPGDTNARDDVFVHDRVTGATQRVSVASDGTQANSDSAIPAISADGRYVAFWSDASNLIPGDTNGSADVFVRDRATGTTERVSVASNGIQANSYSYYTAISGDGRYVVFSSHASNLVPGDTSAALDVFVHDRATGTTERVSVASDGTQANCDSDNYPVISAIIISGNPDSDYPAISGDGRYVAFSSQACNLVPGDTNGTPDMFVHDRVTGTTERVSVASDGTQANSSSYYPAISGDGRYVVFSSSASNLVPGDLLYRDIDGITNDVFVHDRVTGATELVSVASDGTQANESSFYSAISAEGRYVAFTSTASNLVPGDTNMHFDVFVHDRVTGATELVSGSSDGTQADNSSLYPAISAEGRHVAFLSYASNLVPGDTNGVSDVFVHERGGSLGVVGTPSVLKVPGGVGVSGLATFSGATLAEATDPDDDGTGVGPLEAADVGAELTGTALVYRPEQEDLLLRMDLSSLPPAAGGLPGILYGLELGSGGTSYEVRALRAAATSLRSPVFPSSDRWPQLLEPHVALYRCDLVCTEHAPLTGSFGTTGDQVLVSVPLSALGAAEGTGLTGLRAFTAVGEATPGALHLLDEAPLSSSVIPASRVELGIAPASTSEDAVAFTVEADLLAGEFSGAIPTDGLSAGSYRVWARTCLGDACGPAAFGEVAL